MLSQIPIFIVARGNNEMEIKCNKELLKYAYVFIKEMNLFKQTYIISDNIQMLEYAKELGFVNTYHQPCKDEKDIIYLHYNSIYNFHKETNYKPDWFILLAINQLFRNSSLIVNCIKNIDNKYDVIASYTEISDRSKFFIENGEIVTKSHLVAHERDRKKMVDSSIYAIQSSFAIKCMTTEGVDPSEVFWNGKIKYFKNTSPYTDIYEFEDIKRYNYVGNIINKTKELS